MSVSFWDDVLVLRNVAIEGDSVGEDTASSSKVISVNLVCIAMAFLSLEFDDNNNNNNNNDNNHLRA